MNNTTATAVRLLPVADTYASLAIDGPAAATFNTIVQASLAYEGPIGKTITLALAAGGTWVPNIGTFTASSNPTNAKATGTLTLAATGPLNTETVTIGSRTYTFQTVLTNVAGNVLIGATNSDTCDNLIAAITAGAGSGTLYAAATTVHPTVTAAAGAGDTVTITALSRGTAGNSIATTEAATDTSFGAATLTGGTLETVTIDTTVYTLKHSDNLTTAYDVKIGASASDTLDNLIAAINANGTPGTHYYTGTLVHPTVRAFAGAGDTMVVHTNADTILTAVGTLIATTETCAACAWGAATLADGTNGTNVEFAVTDTAVSCVFSSGYTTVSDFEAALAADEDVSALLRVKTAGTTPLYRLVVADDDFSATNLTGAGATSSAAPTLTTEPTVRLPFHCDQALLLVHNVDVIAGTTKTADLAVWGWVESQQLWYYIGKPNAGTALAEVASDTLSHSEMLTGLRRFTALYCQVVSLGGSGTEVEVWVDCVRAEPVSH